MLTAKLGQKAEEDVGPLRVAQLLCESFRGRCAVPWVTEESGRSSTGNRDPGASAGMVLEKYNGLHGT